MRILSLLLVVLFMMFQGAAGKECHRTMDPCIAQNGRCVPGICRRPYYWIGTCSNGLSCCRKYVEG
ncbi:OSTR3 protein, partial [Alcedo cyanopectus]|nr:OSTR3 protein [Ceyx cyanopectus]